MPKFKCGLKKEIQSSHAYTTIDFQTVIKFERIGWNWLKPYTVFLRSTFQTGYLSELSSLTNIFI